MQILEAYLEQNRQYLEFSTIQMRKACFVSLMKVSAEPNSGHIKRWQCSIVDSGRSKVTANSYVKMVRPVFSWAAKEGLIDENPFDGIRLFKVPQQRIRFFEDEEVMAMMEIAPLRWKALIMLARTSGLRRGECLNLTIPDFDLDRMLVYVCAKNGTLNTWPWHAKSFQLRKLPLAEATARLIEDLINELPVGQPYPLLTEKRYKHLLSKHLAGILSPRQQKTPVEHFSVPFNKIRKRAGVNSGTFHDLRRTFVTYLATAGHPIHEVQKLAGHADIKTTMTYYAGIAPDALERARRLINAGLSASSPQSCALPNCATPRKQNHYN